MAVPVVRHLESLDKLGHDPAGRKQVVIAEVTCTYFLLTTLFLNVHMLYSRALIMAILDLLRRLRTCSFLNTENSYLVSTSKSYRGYSCIILGSCTVFAKN